MLIAQPSEVRYERRFSEGADMKPLRGLISPWRLFSS